MHRGNDIAIDARRASRLSSKDDIDAIPIVLPNKRIAREYLSSKIEAARREVDRRSPYFPSLEKRIGDAKDVLRLNCEDWRDHFYSAVYLIDETVEKNRYR